MPTIPVSTSEKPAIVSRDILYTLAYFDIFNFPLTADELYSNSSLQELTKQDLITVLQELIVKGNIESLEDFYFLPGKSASILKRRADEARTDFFIQKAKKYSGIIASFPFVEAVFLSGTISKGVMEEDSDIDYFIVTSPQRLWIARTMMVFFKKVVLLNSRKYFCINYFVDAEHLKISDQNIFTARELSYLLPIYDHNIYRSLVEQNKWIHDFLPNFTSRSGYTVSPSFPRLKKISEFLLNNFVGNLIDKACMKFTVYFWKQKHGTESFAMQKGIRCERHIAKYHPRAYQHVVNAKLNNKMDVLNESLS